MSKIFDKTLNGLSAAAHYRKIKGDVINSNIANAETPGYKAKRFDFEDALARQLRVGESPLIEKTHERHIAAAKPVTAKPLAVDVDSEGVTANDGNTVDLEKEMTRLAENQVQFKALVQLINKKLAALKYAAGEGR